MKCQKCNKNEANTHITKIVNGVKTEQYLCEKCAAENQDFINFQTGFDKEFDNFFSGFFGMLQLGIGMPQQSDAKTCPVCGSTLDDITNRGKLGCSECYSTFKDFLMHPLKQIHGRTLNRRRYSGIKLTTLKSRRCKKVRTAKRTNESKTDKAAVRRLDLRET